MTATTTTTPTNRREKATSNERLSQSLRPDSNRFAVASQRRLLESCRTREELEALARREQAKRDLAARQTWRNYRLLYLPGFRYAVGVTNPEGVPYLMEQDSEGVCCCFCADCQGFVADLNARLKAAGSRLRVQDKHALIRHLLEREEWRVRGTSQNPDYNDRAQNFGN